MCMPNLGMAPLRRWCRQVGCDVWQTRGNAAVPATVPDFDGFALIRFYAPGLAKFTAVYVLPETQVA
jgi:hypothetical protein